MKTLVTQRDSGNKAVTTISNQLYSNKWYPDISWGGMCANCMKSNWDTTSQKPGW